MQTTLRAAVISRAVAAWLTAGMLVLQGASVVVAAPPGGNDSTAVKPKPAALAPHHTGQTTYGAPIQSPILHKRHKRSPPDSTKPKVTSRTSTQRAVGTKGAGTKAAGAKVAGTKAKATAPRASDSNAAGDRSLPPDPAYRQPSESAAH